VTIHKDDISEREYFRRLQRIHAAYSTPAVLDWVRPQPINALPATDFNVPSLATSMPPIMEDDDLQLSAEGNNTFLTIILFPNLLDPIWGIDNTAYLWFFNTINSFLLPASNFLLGLPSTVMVERHGENPGEEQARIGQGPRDSTGYCKYTAKATVSLWSTTLDIASP